MAHVPEEVKFSQYYWVQLFGYRSNAKLRGYYNYYGVIGNYDSLKQFFDQVKRILFKWLNRRSQRRSYNWKGFSQLLEHYRIEQPRIRRRNRARQLQLV